MLTTSSFIGKSREANAHESRGRGTLYEADVEVTFNRVYTFTLLDNNMTSQRYEVIHIHNTDPVHLTVLVSYYAPFIPVDFSQNRALNS